MPAVTAGHRLDGVRSRPRGRVRVRLTDVAGQGDVVAGYTLVRRLGSGGMGTVWEARDGAGVVVALKLLHPGVNADPDSRARLAREVANLHRLKGARVSRVLDAEIDDEVAFIATELVDGISLEESVASEGAFDPVDLHPLAVGLADAVRGVHAVGLLHRDIKPGNVMVTYDGPVLIDFGIAQLLDDARLTHTGFVTGTPGYLDPASIAGGAPDRAGDWYGWAAVLLFAATGRPPFGRGRMEAVIARMTSGAPDVEGLDPGVAAAFRAALAVEPAARPDPQALLDVLELSAEGLPTPPPQATVVVPAVPPRPTARLAVGPTGSPAQGSAVPAELAEARGSTGAAGAAAPVEPTAGGVWARVRARRSGAASGGTAAGATTGGAPGASGPGGTGGGVAGQATAATVSYPPRPLGRAEPAAASPSSVPETTLPLAPDPRAGGYGAQPGLAPAAPPPWAAPPPPRAGLVTLSGAAAAALASRWPGLAVVTTAGAFVLLTTLGLMERRTRRRRLAAGPRRSDGWVAAGWALPLLPLGALTALLPLLIGTVVTSSTWWIGTTLVTTDLVGNVPDDLGPFVAPVALAAGLTAAWWVPVAQPTRTGARAFWWVAAPGPTATRVWVALLAVAVVVLLVLGLVGAASWWPLPTPPQP